MTISKQVIYPLRYVFPFVHGKSTSEAQFKKGFGNRFGPDVGSLLLGRARTGIYLLTKYAVRGGKCDVLLSPYTIPDVVNMVRFGGGRPVFVDVRANSTNMDVALLEGAIDDNTACVLITHYHVNQNELPRIKKLCASRNVPLYGDCAIALGGQLLGRPIGEWCDASVFSLSAYKALNFFWAGVLITSDHALLRFVENETADWGRLSWQQYAPQILRTLGYDLATRGLVFRLLVHPLMKRSLDRSWEWKNLPPRIESTRLDSTLLSRPSYGALWELGRKIGRVAENLEHRRCIAQVYDEVLSGQVVAPETSSETRQGSCFVNYPILIDPETRSEVYKQVIRMGFDVGLSLYTNVQEHPNFHEVPGITRNVTALVRSVLTLPTHPRVSKDYAFRLARVVESTIARRGAHRARQRPKLALEEPVPR